MARRGLGPGSACGRLRLPNRPSLVWRIASTSQPRTARQDSRDSRLPKPGILFYDITTLLKDPAAYRDAST